MWVIICVEHQDFFYMAFLGNPENPSSAATGKGDNHNPTNGWWFRNPTITSWYGRYIPLQYLDRVLHIPTGCFGISEPPTAMWHLLSVGRLDPQEVAVGKGGISKVGLPGGFFRRHGGPAKICLTQRKFAIPGFDLRGGESQLRNF